MANLEMGGAWGGIIASKTELEWDPSRDETEKGAVGGSQNPCPNLLDVHRDGVWCMPHPTWGIDGKTVRCSSVGYAAWARSLHA